MLVAHDLLLLLLDDETGKITWHVHEPDKALAGALLIDLAARELVSVAGEGAAVKKGRLVVRAGAAPEEPVLRRALDVVAERAGRKPDAVLAPLAKGLRDQLADDLVAAGVLRREEHRSLGLFRTTRLPAADDSYENALRAELAAVLAGTRRPDGRTGPLIALLYGMDAVTKLVTVADKRTAKRHAKQVAEGDWAAAAVRDAVQATQQAVIVAVIAATTVATTAGT